MENKSGGTYFFSTEKAAGAPKNKVWKHEKNDRYIFSNDSVLGWRIGKKKQLQTGTYLFKSDLESLKLEEDVEWKQNDGSSIYVKCTLCTNEGIGFGTGVITLSFSISDITSDGLVAK